MRTRTLTHFTLVRCHTHKIRGENFHEWFQICEIRESFIPRKFPAIRYIYIPIARAECTIMSLALRRSEIIHCVNGVATVNTSQLTGLELKCTVALRTG